MALLAAQSGKAKSSPPFANDKSAKGRPPKGIFMILRCATRVLTWD